MKKAICLLIVFLSLTIHSKTYRYSEGFGVRIPSKSWRISSFDHSKLGLALVANSKRGKNRVKYFSVNIKPGVTNLSLKDICKQNKNFLVSNGYRGIRSNIFKQRKTKICYINYSKNRTEQIFFKTKKNYLVAITVENTTMRKRNAKNLIKYFKIR